MGLYQSNSNQTVMLEVMLGSHSSGSLTVQMCKIGTGIAWEFRVDSENHYVQVRAEHGR